MTTNLPIESDKTLTVSDIPEEMLSKLNNTDLFNDFEWEIISYDYDEKAQDMAYFELIVEDRKVITLSMDEYGITWSLGDKENKWVYQVIINGDVHREYRYELYELLYDVLYELKTYKKYNDVIDKYEEFTTWELYDVNQSILDIKEELHMRDANISNQNPITGSSEKLEADIEKERNKLRKIESYLSQLESITTILDEHRI